MLFINENAFLKTRVAAVSDAMFPPNRPQGLLALFRAVFRDSEAIFDPAPSLPFAIVEFHPRVRTPADSAFRGVCTHSRGCANVYLAGLHELHGLQYSAPHKQAKRPFVTHLTTVWVQCVYRARIGIAVPL